MCGISKETDLVLRSTEKRAFWTLSFFFFLHLFSYRSQMYLPPAITQSWKEEDSLLCVRQLGGWAHLQAQSKHSLFLLKSTDWIDRFVRSSQGWVMVSITSCFCSVHPAHWPHMQKARYQLVIAVVSGSRYQDTNIAIAWCKSEEPDLQSARLLRE